MPGCWYELPKHKSSNSEHEGKSWWFKHYQLMPSSAAAHSAEDKARRLTTVAQADRLAQPGAPNAALWYIPVAQIRLVIHKVASPPPPAAAAVGATCHRCFQLK